MICSKCGKEIMDNNNFCPNCGEKIGNNVIGQERILKTQPVKVKTNGWIVINFILLLCIFLLLVSILSTQKRQQKGKDPKSILVVEMVDEDYDGDLSDSTQIDNAIKSGGMIILNISDLDSSLESKIDRYGAIDADGMYYVKGALLNYLASRGWVIQHAPSSGLSDAYYFYK